MMMYSLGFFMLVRTLSAFPNPRPQGTVENSQLDHEVELDCHGAVVSAQSHSEGRWDMGISFTTVETSTAMIVSLDCWERTFTDPLQDCASNGGCKSDAFPENRR